MEVSRLTDGAAYSGFVSSPEDEVLILKHAYTCLDVIPCLHTQGVKQSRYRPGVAQRVPGS
jgi:hypothetical protein